MSASCPDPREQDISLTHETSIIAEETSGLLILPTTVGALVRDNPYGACCLVVTASSQTACAQAVCLNLAGVAAALMNFLVCLTHFGQEERGLTFGYNDEKRMW